MDEKIKNEYLKVNNLISESDFHDNCEKLHHRFGLTEKDKSRFCNTINGHLEFHDKNDFPIRAVYEDVYFFALDDYDISMIYSEAIIKNIDLLDSNCQYVVVYDRENIFGSAVTFISKDNMNDKVVLDCFKNELLDYILCYCDEGLILKKYDKDFTNFTKMDDLINFLNKCKDEFPSLNWSLKYYSKYNEKFNKVKEVYSMITEFEFMYQFVEGEFIFEVPPDELADNINETMDSYYEIYNEYHDSYDPWDQYGANVFH